MKAFSDFQWSTADSVMWPFWFHYATLSSWLLQARPVDPSVGKCKCANMRSRWGCVWTAVWLKTLESSDCGHHLFSPVLSSETAGSKTPVLGWGTCFSFWSQHQQDFRAGNRLCCRKSCSHKSQRMRRKSLLLGAEHEHTHTNTCKHTCGLFLKAFETSGPCMLLRENGLWGGRRGTCLKKVTDKGSPAAVSTKHETAKLK